MEASRSYTIIVQKHAAGTTMFYSTVNSSTTATSRRDQTAVLYYSPFVGFFGSFLPTKKEQKETAPAAKNNLK